MTQSRKTLLAMTMFFVVFVIGGLVIYLVEQGRISKQREVVNEIGSSQAYALQRQLDRSLSSTLALASILRQNNGRLNNFDALAAEIINSYGGITNLQLAPNGVVRQIYPLAGNEQAIGLDLLNDPRNRTEALAAIESRKLTLAGPFELIQGGVAIIGRLPVFISDETGQEHFWGFTTALIRLSEFLEATDLNRMVESGYAYQLSRLEPNSNQQVIFAQSGKASFESPVTFEIEIPNGSWTLSIMPSQGWGWSSFSLAVEVMLLGLLSSLAAWFTYTFLKQPEALSREVALRTRELQLINRQLKTESFERRQVEEALQLSNTLLDALSQAQLEFISSSDTRALFDGLLNNLLEITQSEYGFIGEILHTPAGDPYLKTHAITNIAWNKETRTLYEQNAPSGLKFYNLKSLYGAVMTGGKPVIANHPATDSRRGGLPDGHPPLTAFLGLPFYSDQEMVGMIAIANRPNGYDQVLVEFLQPLLHTCAGAIVSYRNNQQRRAVEVALRESEERYRSLIENTNDLIQSVAPDGRFLFVNRAWHKTLNYTPADLPNLDLWKIIHPESLSHCQGVFARVVDGESLENFQATFVTRDGRPIKLEGNVVGRYLDGNLVATHAFLRDVTERVQAETALAREREMLAQRVDDRTAELRVANAELIQANRLKDEFLAAMSHELRTPLNSILGLSESLEAGIFGNLNPEQIESIGDIANSGQHLLSLINDILDLSKIGAGKLELHLTDVAVKEICQTSLNLFQPQVHQKKLKVITTFDESVSTVFADERHLKQILVNLLSNAVKFTPEGGQIGLEVIGDEAQQTARITVWDTGIGISAVDVPRLFEPFIQLDSRLSRRYEGSGLGLALVQQLTDLHGGSITVESEPNRGSRFTVTLPWQKPTTQPGGQHV